jgi:Tol biopolymer transport system component/predicted Ser/Thr protein kinase
LSLPPGTRIGSYEVTSAIGAGGMGEVYRARDTKLNRDVAIKVLPEVFALDADRLARFEREAKALAALNHPNIAAIYGIEERALVMELVEGQDLSALVGSRLALPDILPIARQIVDALEAAHEAGIVHRDLKPGNIKVRADGAVKILDFGLAKASGPDAASGGSDLMNSPTLTARATQLGVILGTAAYMAPEQAKGRAVDKRADIWAFGVVLFEMLTGDRAFKGEDVSETLASVLTREPDLASLPPGTPKALHRLIGRCLTRDPRQRLRDIGDARFDLTEAERGPDVAAAVSAPPARASRALVLGLAAVAVLASAIAGWLVLKPGGTSAQPVHLSIALPEGHGLVSGPAISRDGRRVAFVSTDGVARPQLYVRDLDGTEARLIKGTEEANFPFFSPDGQWVAFYARNALFKGNVDGSAPVLLAQSASNSGGTWTESGTIIFKKTWNGGLDVVGENGGEPKTFLTTGPDEYSYSFPRALPGGRDILFASWGKTFATVLLDTSSMTRRVVGPNWWQQSAYAPAGYLVTATLRELRALKIAAAGSAPGDALTLMKGVNSGTNRGSVPLDLSENGTLVYVTTTPDEKMALVTVDRHGQVSPLKLPDGVYEFRVAPDGRRAAVIARNRVSILDLDRGTLTPLAPELDSAALSARTGVVWSHDGTSVAFASTHQGSWDIYSKSVSGAGELVTVLKQPEDQMPLSYAPDGTLLYRTSGPLTGSDLWLLPPGGPPKAWLSSAAEEFDGRFSPDGRTISYVSNASGRAEVYIQSRDSATDRFQVSATGGVAPVWSAKGDRVYFRQGNVMMEAVVNTTGGRLSSSAPVQLFNGGWTLSQPFPFDVIADDRFLMIQQPREAVPPRIEVILNWFTVLNERAGRSK